MVQQLQLARPLKQVDKIPLPREGARDRGGRPHGRVQRSTDAVQVAAACGEQGGRLCQVLLSIDLKMIIYWFWCIKEKSSVLVGVGHDLGQVVEVELDAFLQVVRLQKLLEFVCLFLRQGLAEVHQHLLGLLHRHLVGLLPVRKRTSLTLDGFKGFH